jgi:hypothetical protein
VRKRSDSAALQVRVWRVDAARLQACVSAVAATEIAWRTLRWAALDQVLGCVLGWLKVVPPFW